MRPLMYIQTFKLVFVVFVVCHHGDDSERYIGQHDACLMIETLEVWLCVPCILVTPDD